MKKAQKLINPIKVRVPKLLEDWSTIVDTALFAMLPVMYQTEAMQLVGNLKIAKETCDAVDVHDQTAVVPDNFQSKTKKLIEEGTKLLTICKSGLRGFHKKAEPAGERSGFR